MDRRVSQVRTASRGTGVQTVSQGDLADGASQLTRAREDALATQGCQVRGLVVSHAIVNNVTFVVINVSKIHFSLTPFRDQCGKQIRK